MGSLKEKELIYLSDDRDSRMRTTALQGLALMCNGGKCLSLSSYRRITELCDNSEKNVRLIAMKIVFVFAEKHPEEEVKTARGFVIRLHDDAFAVICHLINDLEPMVRAEAARLLGCFASVSDSFLHQTLDKKLMRQMRMLSDGTVAKDAGSKWSTGKKLGEDVEMEKDEEESQSLIPTGACGAFVTALEDEFMAVRQAAVYSLGKLAVNRPEFAKKCIDHLADMFNDEIQQVRLDAIRALSPLVTHGILQQDQLHTILTVLDDANAENRSAIHQLLSKSHLADVDCVKQCIRILLHSLKRFPFDKFSIYQCLSAIGLNHSLFVHGFVTELLEIHPIFDTPEQHIDDDFYLGKLILVLNAASKHPVICSLIPAYVKKHYRYLRCAASHLIPVVKEIEETKLRNKVFDFSVLADEKVDTLLQSTYNRIVEAYSKEESERVILLDMILRDLQAYQSIEEAIAVPAGFLHRFCKVVKLYHLAMTSARCIDNYEPALAAFEACCEDILWIENQYNGTNRSILAYLAECSFKLIILEAAIRLDSNKNYQQQFVLDIREAITKTNRRLRELNVGLTTAMGNLINWITRNVQGVDEGLEIKAEAIKSEFGSTLKCVTGQRLLTELGYAPSRIPNQIPNLRKIAMKSVKVIDPSKDVQNETTTRFVSGLPTAIKLTCLLTNLSEDDLDKFRIQVQYPDQIRSYFRPRHADFHRLNERMVRVQTNVIVTATVWAEPANLQLSCGVLSTLQCRGRNFVPLADADLCSYINMISVKIHPMLRA